MSSKDSARWSRVLLKVSGEAFAGNNGYGIDGEIVTQIAKEIVDVEDVIASIMLVEDLRIQRE